MNAARTFDGSANLENRVILFEDDDINRKTLTMIMERMGYQVVSFPDPAAVAWQWRLRPSRRRRDLVITDNRMPAGSGLEWVRWLIREGFAHDDVAIMSGFWKWRQLEEARALGVHLFFKPFSIDELSQWLAGRSAIQPPGERLVLDMATADSPAR